MRSTIVSGFLFAGDVWGWFAAGVALNLLGGLYLQIRHPEAESEQHQGPRPDDSAWERLQHYLADIISFILTVIFSAILGVALYAFVWSVHWMWRHT